MGGSDFHGINSKTEREPGAIPFPRLHVKRFLAHALRVWQRPLVERLQSITKSIKLAGPDACASEELLIWREQEPLARRTIEDLGMTAEIVESPCMHARVTLSGSMDSDSHYRTIRVSSRGQKGV